MKLSGDFVRIAFADKQDWAIDILSGLVQQDSNNPESISMADVLVLTWAAIRKGYTIHQEREPNGPLLPGLVYFLSPSKMEELYRDYGLEKHQIPMS